MIICYQFGVKKVVKTVTQNLVAFPVEPRLNSKYVMTPIYAGVTGK